MSPKEFEKRIKETLGKGAIPNLLEPDELEEFLTSVYLDECLYEYFSGTDLFVPSFELMLAENAPQEYVKAVRLNQYFLKKERMEFLLNLSLPKELKIHQIIWEYLQKEESEIWCNIQIEMEKLLDLPLMDVLIYTVLWIENQRFVEDSYNDLNHLGEVYSFFMGLYLATGKEKVTASLDQQVFFDRFYKSFLIVENEDNPLTAILMLIDNWLVFNDTILTEYCYDLKVEPEMANGMIYLNSTPALLYQWKLDGCRYPINRLWYRMDAIRIVEYLEDEKSLVIPKGQFQADEAMNWEQAVKQCQTQQLLADLAIDSLVFQKTEIEITSLLSPLLVYSTNRLYRYELVLDQHKPEMKKWSSAFLKVLELAHKRNIEVDPYFLMSIDEYLEMNRSVLEGHEVSVKEELIPLFSIDAKTDMTFDRFKKKYEVWKKPFVVFGEMLFCPIAFVANNDWFYGFAQAALDNLGQKGNTKVEKETSTEMELYFASCFEQKGFKVKWFSDKEAKNVNGDIDIIVEDETAILFIQLKRPYFRLNLLDQHTETLNVDNKAVRQLNTAEVFFSQPNDLYFLQQKPVKWIVTTSFEKIGATIKGCRKVNYFSILRALRVEKIDRLDALIDYVEKDMELRDLMEIKNIEGKDHWISQELDSIGFPIPIVESQKYRKILPLK